MAELVRKYVVMAVAAPEPFDPSDHATFTPLGSVGVRLA
jgi:hypothetical protein